MQRYMRDSFHFDFGEDDDSGIFWDASVTIDTEYDSIQSYRIGNVRIDGKVISFPDVESDLQNRIRERMNTVETAEFMP